MEFEYDPNKSATNFERHGIDFDRAQLLWDDLFLLELQAKSLNEKRYLYIGIIDEEHWSAITTFRKNAVRIISVRSSRKNEIELYESARFG